MANCVVFFGYFVAVLLFSVLTSRGIRLLVDISRFKIIGDIFLRLRCFIHSDNISVLLDTSLATNRSGRFG